jgi:glycolate oxidase
VTAPAYTLLEKELGSNKVILRGDDRLDDYSHDESYFGRFPPDAAVLCDTVEEVGLVLRLAQEHKIPVTPRGAGSGMTGGALPIRGGIVLSTERMKKVKEIDDVSLIAVVEPGVILGEFQQMVEARGLFYPPDPASLGFCSLGGNVAECAGGPRAFKYGVTREYVLGLDVTLMGGERIRCGRRTAKGVTGYDVTALFVGSEGTFGVTTEITLKLLPMPPAVATMLAIFPDAPAAGDAVTAILRLGTRPRALELLDANTLEHLRGKGSYRFPQNAGAVVICEIDGEPEGLEPSVLRCAEAAEKCGAIDVLVARDEQDRRRMWETRRLASPSLKEAHRFKVNEDVAVPRAHIAELLRRADAVGAHHDFEMATFGHAGDGNLHINMLGEEDRNDPRVQKRIDDALGELFTQTIALGGTLSGEHGIGLAKMKYMTLEQSAELISLQKRLKRLLDPADLLNPGKILP